MRRLSVLMIGAMVLTAPALASPPSAVAGTLTPSVVAGTYKVFVKWWPNSSWDDYRMTLKRNHTGTDNLGSTMTWSRSGKTVTIKLVSPDQPGLTVTYIGTKNRHGFNSKRSPGTMSNTAGDYGVWYAVQTS